MTEFGNRPIVVISSGIIDAAVLEELGARVLTTQDPVLLLRHLRAAFDAPPALIKHERRPSWVVDREDEES